MQQTYRFDVTEEAGEAGSRKNPLEAWFCLGYDGRSAVSCSSVGRSKEAVEDDGIACFPFVSFYTMIQRCDVISGCE